jgi:hypothetical protein
MTRLVPAILASMALFLSACSNEPQAAPKAKAKTEASPDRPVAVQGEQPGTAMAERVAVIGLLNKRNGQTRNFELKPGEAARFGKVVIRVRACEKTAPWETVQDQGAFVQLIVSQRPAGTTEAERWAQVFSGWLFKENPSANIVQHPVYDVWVKECRMSFPGDDAPVESSDDDDAPSKRSSAPQSAPSPERAKPEAEREEATEPSGDGEATVET